jgi:1,4-dihydroxy-2-naphthoate octaprenyltransferase
MIGQRATIAEYVGLVVVAYAVPVALVLAGVAGPLALLPLVSLPLAAPFIRAAAAGGDPRRLNAVLRATARLSLIYSALFAVGLAAGLGAGGRGA